jgi:hypothetical protein
MKMLVPIPILLACPSADTTGDHIRWSPGQKATFYGKGRSRPVTIMTGEFVGHDAVPGQLCIEVIDDDGVAACVLASALRLR